MPHVSHPLNPFRQPPSAKVKADISTVSRELLREIRSDDAAMAGDLVALAPRSGRAYRSEVSGTSTLHAASPDTTFGAAGTSSTQSAMLLSGRSGGIALADNDVRRVEVRDNSTTHEYVQQKRDIGLVRMSLMTKKAEIRKLEEKIDRAEKRLRQQQEQLTNTREKFNNFLKYSNLEQDAAVRRADDETRAKHAKTVEIKKLSALINHVEMEIKKTEAQLENCFAYKKFLESLAKPKWFSDVLTDLRIADKTEEILLAAEHAYQARCKELEESHQKKQLAAAELAAKEEETRSRNLSTSIPRNRLRLSSSALSSRKLSVSDEEVEELSLEDQKGAVYAEMENDARASVKAATDKINGEVANMSLEEVKAALQRNYDEKRLPMCFADVDELLEVFINVEEGNLFLIQNCQELEEELENIMIDYMQEKEEMESMIEQRSAQLEALARNMTDAQGKLQELEARIATVDSKPRAKDGNGPNAGSKTASGGGASDLLGTNKNASKAEMSPEMLRQSIEAAIARMFRILTSGDQLIKLTTTDITSSTSAPAEAATATAKADARLTAEKGRRGKMGSTVPPTAAPSHRDSLTSRPTTAATTRRSSKTRQKSLLKNKPSPILQQQQQQQQQQQDSSMGPVEMLTIIENKLEEYHRFLTDPNNQVPETLIQAIMKASDKERRRQARVLHLANQATEQEEKIRRALERSEAPITRKLGKPVYPRSYIPVVVDQKTLRKAEQAAAAALNGSTNSIDSDEDGAEFFR